MARERWFYAKEMRRVGPLRKQQLVESLRGLPNPRAWLIWRRGLLGWTPAREVPEIDRYLTPFIMSEPAAPPESAPATAPTVGAAGAVLGVHGTSARPAREGEQPPRPNVALYLGSLAALLVAVVVGGLLWSRSNDREGSAPEPGASKAKSGEAPLASPALGKARSTPSGPSAGTSGFAGWSDQEADLSLAELRRLRGVGGWSGNRLTITLYNGSTSRVTEILVRTSRLRGDAFVDDATPHRLLPVGGAPVDAATADLLNKVAPDRKKPGVNPLDTGPFEAAAGPQPEAYRWKIEGARGYPPRQ